MKWILRKHRAAHAYRFKSSILRSIMKLQGYTFTLEKEVTKRNPMASEKDPHKTSQPPAAAKNTIPIEAKEPVDPSNRPDGFSVVGIGDSAGGLGALRAFFEALPAETGMAFVVITHLHPEYESHMAELLQKSTHMPVMQVTEKTPVEVNHVYVIPTNRSILMTDTHLDTREFDQPHGRRTPIDHFFRSMAAITISDQGRGFDATAIFDDSQGSGGFMNIRHRLQLMGCDIEVESQPGRGTRTIIHVPPRKR